MVSVHNDIFTRNLVKTAVYQILKQQPKAFNNIGDQVNPVRFTISLLGKVSSQSIRKGTSV